ncbi:alpha/beta-hydrolase [Delitschia confertaspora ATCC 74209]|uniref:Carboxylic ester hydrolase n=1 Tax=Delitschia confertaspora ATCC 74209 TaxID=1513339 RepID=A0A9P4JIB3_9PLEO|nr:alpha/beta-hydrolase [Delitschia confertaspora ATCC 74209]
MITDFEHAQLGQLKGKHVDGVVQFRGLKYASLENRLAPPQLVTYYGSGPTDASNFGPPPVSPPMAIHQEFGFIQQSLPLPDVPSHSDLEGLNLNVTVPLVGGAIDPNAKLPVYIFVHGGGFAVGSSWYPHYDPAPLIKLSVEKRKPIIGITINYRLGALGFMTSEELRKAGFKANNGFHDQRVALKWIKNFVGGFGGDPEEITVCGESAGGLSVTALLFSEEPLMKRCLSTGGAILLFKPLTTTMAESSYKSVIEALGLANKSPEERIEALLTLPYDDLWQKAPLTAPMSPVLDAETFPGEPNFVTVSSQTDDGSFPMPGRKWCASLMIGESALDASILAWMGLEAQNPGIASKFIESIKKTLSSHPEAATELLKLYDITPSTNDEEALLSILRFATDISFYAPSRAFAQGWPKTEENKFFMYHFNEGNPWDGRFKGEAGHILDVAFLFQNYNHLLNDQQKAVAKAYGEDFIEFVNGNDPWPPVKAGGKFGARVYGPSREGMTAKYVASGDPEEIGRRPHVLKLGEMAGFDAVLEGFQTFLRGG